MQAINEKLGGIVIETKKKGTTKIGFGSLGVNGGNLTELPSIQEKKKLNQ
jgi:hypothetical protein